MLGLVMAMGGGSVLYAQPVEDPGAGVVALVAEQIPITAADLSAYLAERPHLVATQPRAEAYRQALDALVTAALKRVDLFASGLAADSALLRQVHRIATEELVLAYARHRYEEAYLNEEAIGREHALMGRVVHARQLVLPRPAGASDAALDSLRAVVEGVQQALEAGTPFETLRLRYAAGQTAPRTLRITWEMTARNPRAYHLFRLAPGDVRSFEEPHRFSVVQIERIERHDPPPMAEARPRIVEALQGRHAAAATRAYRQEWLALVDTLALRWNAAALDRLVAWANTPGFFEGRYTETVRAYLADHPDAVLLDDGRGALRLSDLPRLFDEVLTLRRSGGRTVAYMQDFLLEAVRTRRLAERARALGYWDRVWRPDTPSPILAGAFVRYYDEHVIAARLPHPTMADLQAFYQAHLDSLFYQPARVYTEIITRSRCAEVAALRDRILQGVPFEEASHRRLIRSYERTRSGQIVTRNSREPAYFGALAFGLAEGEVSEPVAYEDPREGPRCALVRVTRRLPEGPRPFDKIRDEVVDAFTAHHRQRLEREVAASLRARYPVTVYPQVLHALADGAL